MRTLPMKIIASNVGFLRRLFETLPDDAPVYIGHEREGDGTSLGVQVYGTQCNGVDGILFAHPAGMGKHERDDAIRARMGERDRRIDRLEVRVKLLQDTMAHDENIPLPCSRETHCEPRVAYDYTDTGV